MTTMKIQGQHMTTPYTNMLQTLCEVYPAEHRRCDVENLSMAELSESLPKGLRCFEVPDCPGKILQGGADAVRPLRGEVEVPSQKSVLFR